MNLKKLFKICFLLFKYITKFVFKLSKTMYEVVMSKVKFLYF